MSKSTIEEPRLSLAAQFAIASAFILFNVMTLLGGWISTQIERAVTKSAAGSMALYLESYLEPLVQEAAVASSISSSNITKIEALLENPSVPSTLLAIRILTPDGRILYARDRTSIGTVIELPDGVQNLMERSEVQVLDAPQDKAFSDLAGPLFRILTPMHALGTNHVIAIAELYESAQFLTGEFERVRHATWVMVGTSSVAMLGLLYAVVQRGSRLIGQQRVALEDRVDELRRILEANSDLQSKLQTANRRNSEINERFLRRVSSDLHDGPAQYLALALLRHDELVSKLPQVPSPEWRQSHEAIRMAIEEAMREIRNISSGLALPELQKISPKEALLSAVRAHERATGVKVERDIGEFPGKLPLPITVCLFRFAQEALNNGFRHAGGKSQAITSRVENGILTVEVSDKGPGIPADATVSGSHHLGLVGLKHRIESLGGRFHIASELDVGTRLMAMFELANVPEVRL